MITCANPACRIQFQPKRADQRYHSPKCRMAAYAARTGDGALRAPISRITPLKGGEVNVILRFAAIDRENALSMLPGRLLEIIPCPERERGK